MSEVKTIDIMPETGAGALLRQARETAGVQIGALAAVLKVPVKKMEALENDRFELFPDVVFVRALASSICRILKVDATQVLERLPRLNMAEMAHPSVNINEPFRPSRDKRGQSWWSQISKPALTTGAFLLVGALVMVFLPAIKDQLASFLLEKPPITIQSPSNLLGIATETSVLTKGVLASTSISPLTTDPVSAIEPVAPASVGMATVLANPAHAGASMPVAVWTGGLSSVINPATLGSITDATSLVQFRAQGQTWVEVTDANGVVVLRRILKSGEVATASGALPLIAVVGRADAVQVEIRGQPLDLTKVSRDNVARFEVK